MTAARDYANDFTGLIGGQVNALGYLLIVLDQLLANLRLLLVLRHAWLQLARDARDLLEELRLRLEERPLALAHEVCVEQGQVELRGDVWEDLGAGERYLPATVLFEH